MQIEIRNVKHHPDLCEETEAFSADLLIDGRKIGTVSNRGTGGCDDFHGDQAAYDAADRWLRANRPGWSLEPDCPPDRLMRHTIEDEVSAILAKHIGMKQMEKDMRASLIFRKAGEAGLYTIRIKAPHKASDPAVHARLMATYPGATILNALSAEAAWTIYSEASE